MDLDKNEKITFEEFMTWYKNKDKTKIDQQQKEGAKAVRDAKINQLKNQGKANAQKNTQPVLQPLSEEEYLKGINEIRKEVPFENVHIHSAIDLLLQDFKTRSVDYRKFQEYMQKLGKANGFNQEKVSGVTQRLFRILDSNQNGILDVAELGTGLGLLCGGTKPEKMKAGFDLYDENSNSQLDFREASNLMSGFFKIIKSGSPQSFKQYSAQQFGTAMAYRMFEDLKVNPDNEINFSQFQDWLDQHAPLEEKKKWNS